MDRPNRNERIKMQDEYFNKYNDKSYLQALEKYASALEEQLRLYGVSKRLKDYANWIGKNEFTMFADGNWRDGFGNEFTNSELHSLYLNKPNK
ncbi:hypothetical protein [Wenyingzhuangia sp. 2_MG-2023]|uniref:hypothetical protein n=1 Tax=Wenyingzhuangia sp. 2_MG-2023 TaxID=3062639 RepID=UPI0026E238A5|nr:hypothetical protein [Wenyingzhuangia sp. 2_MG-2023]MDO6737121.1 hypothetical protein [Wenyingzhuangia sp. 2_MG-2023]